MRANTLKQFVIMRVNLNQISSLISLIVRTRFKYICCCESRLWGAGIHCQQKFMLSVSLFSFALSRSDSQ